MKTIFDHTRIYKEDILGEYSVASQFFLEDVDEWEENTADWFDKFKNTTRVTVKGIDRSITTPYKDFCQTMEDFNKSQTHHLLNQKN